MVSVTNRMVSSPACLFRSRSNCLRFIFLTALMKYIRLNFLGTIKGAIIGHDVGYCVILVVGYDGKCRRN